MSIQFVPECYKTEKIRFKAVDGCPFVFTSVPDGCKTQEMCDKAVDGFLPELTFVP